MARGIIDAALATEERYRPVVKEAAAGTSEVAGIRLPVEVWQALGEVARQENISRNAAIRNAVYDWLRARNADGSEAAP